MNGDRIISIELPEAKILARQMEKRLPGKHIISYHMQDCGKPQKIGMVNKDLNEFDSLTNADIKAVITRGNVVLLKLGNDTSLILGPEYGGEILYFKDTKMAPEKFHLKVDFSDGTALTAKLTSMGVIQIMRDMVVIQ